MSNFGTLFKIDEKGKLIINKPEIRGVKEYATVLEKKEHQRIFLYVYMMNDPRSQYYILEKNARRKKVLKSCGLPETWRPDKQVIEMIKVYREDLMLTSTAKAYLAADKALFSIGSDVELLQDQIAYIKTLIASKIKQLLGADKIELEEAGLLKELNVLLNEIIKNQDKLIANISKFPSLKDNIEILMAAYAQESGKKPIHGGGSLGNREAIRHDVISD